MYHPRGRFIAFYGMNNLGKSTVIPGVIDFLTSKGIRVGFIKYPIYNLEPTGPRINAYLRGKNPEGLNPLEAQVLYYANRLGYQGELKRRLRNREWIVAEDYKGTGIAWGVIRSSSKDLSAVLMERLNMGLWEPDLSILLDGERFRTGIENGHLHEDTSPEEWNKGRLIFQELSCKYGWRVLKSDQPEHDVLADAVRIVEENLVCVPLRERETLTVQRERGLY